MRERSSSACGWAAKMMTCAPLEVVEDRRAACATSGRGAVVFEDESSYGRADRLDLVGQARGDRLVSRSVMSVDALVRLDAEAGPDRRCARRGRDPSASAIRVIRRAVDAAEADRTGPRPWLVSSQM